MTVPAREALLDDEYLVHEEGDDPDKAHHYILSSNPDECARDFATPCYGVFGAPSEIAIDRTIIVRSKTRAWRFELKLRPQIKKREELSS